VLFFFCDAVSSLAIFAENEAEELLTFAMSRYRESTIFSTACFDALVATAAAGNIRIVKELMKVSMPEVEALDQPILAAIESGDADVFAEIIGAARKAPGRIQNFKVLLARAASLGRTTAAEDLLGLMKASGSSVGMSNGVSPLSYACQRGFVEMVDLLVRDTSAMASDGSYSYA